MSFAARFQSYLDDRANLLGEHKRRRVSFRDYCCALTLLIERKSLEPMAADMDPENVQACHKSLHNLVSSAHWSDRAVLDQAGETIIDAIPANEERYWLIDDAGIPEKGNYSVGVAHQYCDQLGKQAT